jgi:hypothetical protein
MILAGNRAGAEKQSESGERVRRGGEKESGERERRNRAELEIKHIKNLQFVK